jgi:hypothetical protein
MSRLKIQIVVGVIAACATTTIGFGCSSNLGAPPKAFNSTTQTSTSEGTEYGSTQPPPPSEAGDSCSTASGGLYLHLVTSQPTALLIVNRVSGATVCTVNNSKAISGGFDNLINKGSLQSTCPGLVDGGQYSIRLSAAPGIAVDLNYSTTPTPTTSTIGISYANGGAVFGSYRINQSHISYINTCPGDITVNSYGNVGSGQIDFLLKVDVFIGSLPGHQKWESYLLNNSNGVTAINMGGGSATVTNFGNIGI